MRGRPSADALAEGPTTPLGWGVSLRPSNLLRGFAKRPLWIEVEAGQALEALARAKRKKGYRDL
jgi:hypothetical protein